MKSELSSLEKVIDVYLEYGRPTYQEFYTKISEQFDFELANQCQGFMSKICEGQHEITLIVDHMKQFVGEIMTQYPNNRKEQAKAVIGAYGNSGRSSMLFQMLDGKELGNKEYKKLLFQILK